MDLKFKADDLQVMGKINLQCKSTSYIQSNVHIKLNIAVFWVYIGEAMIQIWVEYTNKWVSYEANKCMFK